MSVHWLAEAGEACSLHCSLHHHSFLYSTSLKRYSSTCETLLSKWGTLSIAKLSKANLKAIIGTFLVRDKQCVCRKDLSGTLFLSIL